MSIIFLINLITSKKQIEKNFTRVTDDFIEIQFWKGKKNIPVQITRVPYGYIKDVHMVTGDEWKNELNMGNIFRKIGMWPFRGPSGRFHPGVFRKDLCTIQFSDRMELHDYVEHQGTLGVFLTIFVSVLFSSTDMNLEEQLGVDERMYVSMSKKDREKFIKMIGEKKNAIENYYSTSDPVYDDLRNAQEPLDDSWFTG